MIKYRLKEVAADFGKTPKEISAIMEKFFEKPKSNTQVLTDEELNVICPGYGQPLRYDRSSGSGELLQR